MTSRERVLAAYRGEEIDRLPYWAKMGGAYLLGQSDEFCKLSDFEQLDYIHGDGRFGLASCVRTVRPHVTETVTDTGDIKTTVFHTPDGDLVDKWAFDNGTGTHHPIEFAIKTVEDIGRYRWFYKDLKQEILDDDISGAQERLKEIGQRGITAASWGTSPLMDLIEHIIGPENTNFMLFDYPEQMSELINLMHTACVERARLVARHSPADIVVSVENTSTTLISPDQFDSWCLGHLCDFGRAIEAEGVMHELHMCGHTNVLLEKIDTIPASAIEAFTSPTLGNTRLIDGKTKAPSKTLIGGTNVNTWLCNEQEIKDYISKEISACPNTRRIILTTAGVAPPQCTPDTFRSIGEWLPTVQVRN